MHAITKGLQNEGHEVNIISLFTKKHPFVRSSMDPNYLKDTKFIEVFVDTQVNWVEAYSSLITRDSYNLSRFFTPDFDIELTKKLKKENFDIIQLESLFMCPYIETIRKLSDAKIILRSHNLEFKLWQRRAKNEKNYLKRKYKHYLSKELETYEVHYLKQADGIASITEQDKSEMMALGIKTPIKTIPFGSNLSFNSHISEKCEENSIFHLGSMDWDPNIEAMDWFLNDVMPELNENEEFNFYLAGKKSEDLKGNKKFEKAKIVGEVKSSTDFINSKDIMVVPLKSAGGMRIKIIEGMALGKPIITSTVGAEGIDAEHQKNIMIANTKEEYIKAIQLLTSNPQLKKEIGRNARKLIKEKYDPKIIIKSLIDFYQMTLRK